MNKKNLGSLGLCAIVALSFIGGCSNSQSEGEGPQGTASFKLSKTVGPNSYCVDVTIQISGGGLTNPVLVHSSCADSSHTAILTTGDYNIAALNPVCSQTPTAPTYQNCTYMGPSTFHVDAGGITEVPMEFQYNYETGATFQVTFGAGAADISLATPTSKSHPICGGTIGVAGADGTECAAGQECLQVDNSGVKRCYTLCNYTYGGPNPCTGGEVCMPQVLGQTDTGQGGAFSDNDGESAGIGGAADALSNLQGACVPASAGAGGSGGAPAAGAGGTAGAAAGSGGVGGLSAGSGGTAGLPT